MGLALLIAVMKTLGHRTGGEVWNDAARFWIRIVGINFAMGAFYLLRGTDVPVVRRFFGLGVTAGLLASLVVAFPTGDHQAKLVARHWVGGASASRS